MNDSNSLVLILYEFVILGHYSRFWEAPKASKVFCGCILFGKGPDKNNTEGLRTALARLRNRTGPSIPQPPPSSTSIQPPQTISNSNTNAAAPPAPPAPDQQQQFQQPIATTNNNRPSSSSDGAAHQKNPHDRYVPGSPIFREERKSPPIAPAAPPSTPRSGAKGINDHPQHIQQQQQQQEPCAMTVSVTLASQGAAIVTTKATTPASIPARCYTSTRSAAMMALAMGQRTKSPASVPRAVVNKSRPSVQQSPTSISRSIAPPAAPTKSAVVPPAGVQINGMALSQSGGSGSSGSDNDGFNSSSSSTATALRRLYFKSGRSAKSKVNATATTSMMGDALVTGGTSTYHEITAAAAAGSAAVPKVVVMGSSSASMPDTMISTSTDSASTVVTSVTHTDTSEACDSLDLGDTSGQSEPLFSSLEEPLLTAIQIDSEQDGTELELTTCSMYSRPHLQDSTESQESSLSILVSDHTSTTPLLATPPRRSGGDIGKERLPNTAPAPSSDTSHFTFDHLPEPPMSARSSEKSDSHFKFQDSPPVMNGGRQITPSSTRHNFDDRRVSNSSSRRENSPNSRTKLRSCTANSTQRADCSDFYYDYERERDRNVENNPTRSKKSRIRDSSSCSNTRNRYSTSAATVINAKTSPKREMRRSPSSNKLNSAPPNIRDNNYHGCSGNKPKQLSPSSQYAANQRKYSSSSSSGGSERDREHDREREREHERERSKDISMFPFDREALDYERIQRECFAVEEHSSSATVSSDSDEAEHCSVYERKLSAHHGLSPKSSDIFQQYTLLSQQEQPASISSALSGGPSSRKNSKRVRPKSAMSQKAIPRSDAFHPQAKSSSSPGEHSQSQQAHKSHAELNKFDEIASKFDQIPPKHSGSNANLTASHHHVSTIMNNNQMADGGGSGGGLSRSINNNTGGSAGTLYNNCSPTNSMRAPSPSPPMPDLRVDFFSEVQVHPQRKSFKCKAAATSASCSDNLDGYQRGGGLINVTSNPLEIAAVCTQPRATIVVQQPSLSLDSAVETLLIKNEGDFISVEQGKDLARKRNSQQLQHPPHLPQHLHQHQHQQQQQQQQHNQQQQLKRDENIRQLLDVTNTLTFEELRDFEMRYGSPHHSRSQSVKTPGSRASGRPNQLCLPQQRSRVASMPNTGVEEEYYRLRHFSITGKGVVNRGDSLKSRRSRSNNSVASSNSSTEHLTAAQIPAPTSARTSATCSLASSRESSTSNPGNGPYRVLMLGGTAVGKSSLVSQFMTSEYLHAYDTSIDDESGEKSVSVLLSGEESELIFIDHAYTEMAPDDCLGSYDPHGYCVIYSASDRSSFTIAEHVLQVLWTNQNIAQKAVILVGNKADLARSRSVTIEEGKAMATAYDCKFIETSVGINHNVDELLVGLLSQIRLKLENPEKSRDLFRKRSIRKSKRRACSPLGGVCLTGGGGGCGGTNPNTPLGPAANNVILDVHNTPPGSAHSSPRKYRGSRTSTSLKVKGLLGRVWARDSKSKSCENLHVL